MTEDEVREAERTIAENSCTSPEAEVAMKALLAHWAEEREVTGNVVRKELPQDPR